MITGCIPNYFTIDAKLIGNSRARVTISNAHNHDRERDISINKVGKLCSKTNVTIEELNTLNGHFFSTKLLSVMSKVMQEDSGARKIIRY